jgi:hypothetical protein
MRSCMQCMEITHRNGATYIFLAPNPSVTAVFRCADCRDGLKAVCVCSDDSWAKLSAVITQEFLLLTDG